jgi:hypothetical protein
MKGSSNKVDKTQQTTRSRRRHVPAPIDQGPVAVIAPSATMRPVVCHIRGLHKYRLAAVSLKSNKTYSSSRRSEKK